MIKIEKDIPYGYTLYPFDKMEVGDSFLLPSGVKPGLVSQNGFRYGKKTNKKFSIRNTAQGYRCWRIK